MKRKMLAARLDLADKISEISSRKGTLYDYVNEILEQAIRAEEIGLSLKTVLDDRWAVKAMKDAGFILVPEKIIYDLAEAAYKRVGKEKMSMLWHETGQWYGHYYGDLKKLEAAVKSCFWDVSEFRILEEKETVVLTCLSSKFSATYTELFSKFLEGALNALGFNLNKSEVSKGIINLRFVKPLDK
ncbi:hypothetical protein KEJ18_05725 [Candidatus Bathyarchaeota archaeon]|nr:hypothetical protein [Candidatus Bathyarchaeota archaeon]